MFTSKYLRRKKLQKQVIYNKNYDYENVNEMINPYFVYGFRNKRKVGFPIRKITIKLN